MIMTFCKKWKRTFRKKVKNLYKLYMQRNSLLIEADKISDNWVFYALVHWLTSLLRVIFVKKSDSLESYQWQADSILLLEMSLGNIHKKVTLVTTLNLLIWFLKYIFVLHLKTFKKNERQSNLYVTPVETSLTFDFKEAGLKFL